MKTEQWVVIGADLRRWRMTGNGLIEHAAHGRTVDVFVSDAESAEPTGTHVDHHKDPMATQQDRLATNRSTLQRPSLVGVRKVSQDRPETLG